MFIVKKHIKQQHYCIMFNQLCLSSILLHTLSTHRGAPLSGPSQQNKQCVCMYVCVYIYIYIYVYICICVYI